MNAAIAQQNFEKLTSNPYPGRGIVIGLSKNGGSMLQVYWIMGRSANSRNRLFVAHGEEMRTKAWDESKLEDPSLIIYWPMRVVAQAHIVTNGDQTETIAKAIRNGETLESALLKREFEPDSPNFTPRISGLVDLDGPYAYSLSILKAATPDGESCQRNYFHYEQALRGLGHGITTYSGDGNPLPSFSGEPLWLPLEEDGEKSADLYWNNLNSDNKISLAVKEIDLSSGRSKIRLINKNS